MRNILLVLVMFFTSNVFANEFKVVNYKRHLELIGVVNGNALTLAEQVNALSKASNKPITMLINSPGGSVSTGMVLIDSMRQAKKRGVQFKCISTVLSASMAYIILAECNERYAMNNSLLLWHEISLSVEGAKVRELAVILAPIIALQQRVDKDLESFMSLSASEYQKHSMAETMWTGYELKSYLNNDFIKLVDSADIKTENLYKYMQETFLFGQTGTGFTSVDRILERLTGVE